MSRWKFPEKSPISGRSVDLEPLGPDHLDDLWACAADAAEGFEYLRYGPFRSPAELQDTIADLATRDDQPFWAVRPRETGRASGWLSLCDIDQQNSSIEVGSIWFSPALQQTRAARESLFILMSLAMDTLGYERLVWRCLATNQRSLKAAERLGFRFEGIWRKAALIKGRHFDVAWHSILAAEWKTIRPAYIQWLADENFQADGTARHSLTSLIKDRRNL